MHFASNFYQRWLFALALLLTLGVLPVQAQKATATGAAKWTKLLPENPYAAVVINRPAELNKEILKLTQALNLPVPEVLPLAKFSLGLIQGVDDQRPLVLFLSPFDKKMLNSPNPDGEPPFAGGVWIPTSDVKGLLSNFSSAKDHAKLKNVKEFKLPTMPNPVLLYVHPDQDYVLITPNLFDKDFDKVLPAAKPANLSEQQQQWLDKQDMVAVAYRAGITTSITGIRNQFNAVRNMAGRQQGEQLQKVMDIYDKMFEAIDTNFDNILVAANLDDKSNFTGETRLVLKSDSKLMPYLAKLPTPKSQSLNQLPAIPYLFAMDAQIPSDLLQQNQAAFKAGWIDLIKASYPNATTEDLDQHYESTMNYTKEVQEFCGVIGQFQSGESIMDKLLLSMQAKDAKKLQQLSSEISKLNAKLIGPDKTPPTTEDVKILNLPGLKITTPDFVKQVIENMPANADPNAQQASKTMMRVFYGDQNDLVQWLIQQSPTQLLIGCQQELLADALRDMSAKKNLLAQELDTQATVSLLPAERHTTFLLNIGGYMELMNRMITAQFEAQNLRGIRNPIPEFPVAIPLGFSATLHSTEIQLNMAVPFDFVKQTAEFVQQEFNRKVNPAD
jgi:hypothetical protein